jgi:hypothetical protein
MILVVAAAAAVMLVDLVWDNRDEYHVPSKTIMMCTL